MKTSKYNIIFKYNNKIFVFNTMSGALCEANEDFSNLLDNISSVESNFNEKHNDLLRLAKRGGYIIEDNFDEMSLLKFEHCADKFNTDIFLLAIAPTLSCNFSCPYCYEKFKAGFMPDDVQDAICNQIELAAKSNQYISIIWYGGEPTLAKEIIFKMSQKIIDICNKYSVKYNANIITNGYLIDDEFINQMKKFRITSVQITLDGPREIHNLTRKLKDNSGTFDIIIQNIKDIISKGINVNIRVNITKSNESYFTLLLDTLAGYGLQMCKVLPSEIIPYEESSNSNVLKEYLNRKEWALKVLEYRKMLYEKGFYDCAYPYNPRKKFNYCSAVNANSFVIDPYGNLYKCWTDIGNTSKSIGNILRNKNLNATNKLTSDYFLWSPFDHTECLECNILPFCVGGCPKLGLRNKKPDCSYLKYNLKDVLKMLCDRIK